ncbi:MAG TPA: AraC family transcriptional regulator [Longimicrobium sp.]|nr:AraC family transcriptional regulator [Longimicrobium sp.]
MSVASPGHDGPRFEYPHRLVCAGYSVMLSRYAPGMTMPRHAHEDTAVSIVFSGGMEEDALRGRIDAEAGTLLVKPRGTAHANRFGPCGATILSFSLPRGSGFGDAAAGWSAYRSFEAYRSGIDVLRVLRSGRLDALTGAVSDLLAAVSDAAEPMAAGSAPRWLKEVRAQLDVEPDGSRSVDEIARSLDLHPTYLARRFRAAFRCSVTEYRRRARLLAAARLLSAGDCSLSRAAHEGGFADHSHFCREVKRELGLAPSSLRRLLAPALLEGGESLV